jgi:putative FmdB family regulatory protein
VRRDLLSWEAMATYEYLCLACEHPFEERRSMNASVDTQLACPECGSDRVRRRFSIFAAGAGTSGGMQPRMDAPPSGGCCGGGCACGG